jgi:hypothetical protein
MSSQQICDCKPAQPWTCDPSELNQNSYITPYGCKGSEIYDYVSQKCCICKCDDIVAPSNQPSSKPLNTPQQPSVKPNTPSGPVKSFGPIGPVKHFY